MRLSSTVTDDVGTPTVVFELDGQLVATVTSPPYALDWDASAVTTGTHVWTLRAQDTDGNETIARLTLFADSLAAQRSPFPTSTAITGIVFAPIAAVTQAAQGSDNWPLTWADDDAIYTAYGDGFGFDPPLTEKLSLGYAKVTGSPPTFLGTNIRSATGEQIGDGPSGKKASGLLSVDSVLYQLVRNANNNGEACELARSADYMATWTWSTWRIDELGYCAFANYERDYAGAQDGFVYFYSPDTPSAYNETDTIVLGRVPRDQITERKAYEFFAGFDTQSEPVWSLDISRRQPIFSFVGTQIEST